LLILNIISNYFFRNFIINDFYILYKNCIISVFFFQFFLQKN
ncbi:hypothetical protein HMPREF9015_01275, partial [Leptotrichia wadei F0279]